MNPTLSMVLAAVVVTQIGSNTLIHAEDGTTTVRKVGATIVVEEPDGSRSYCREVGPTLVCTGE